MNFSLAKFLVRILQILTGNYYSYCKDITWLSAQRSRDIVFIHQNITEKIDVCIMNLFNDFDLIEKAENNLAKHFV